MTFRIACGDVMPGCAAVFEDDSEDGLLGQVAHHASASHGLTSVPAEVVEVVRSRIVPVR